MPKEPTEKHRLSDIIVKEISIVDSPANMRKFLLIKNKDGTRYAVGSDNVLLFTADAPVISKDMTVSQYLELQKDAVGEAFNAAYAALSNEEKVQYLRTLEKRDEEANYALLSPLEKAQAQQVEDVEFGPFVEVLQIVRTLKSAIAELSPTQRLMFNADPSAFELVPVMEKAAAPAVRARVVYKAANTLPPVNINVTLPSGQVKKSVTFKRDENGNITGAETEDAQAQ